MLHSSLSLTTFPGKTPASNWDPVKKRVVREVDPLQGPLKGTDATCKFKPNALMATDSNIMPSPGKSHNNYDSEDLAEYDILKYP